MLGPWLGPEGGEDGPPVECVFHGIPSPSPWPFRRWVASPRFALVKERDGALKLRVIDDLSWSGVNGLLLPAEKIAYEGIGVVVHMLRCYIAATGQVPRLLVEDYKAAYRTLPLDPRHRHLNVVAFDNRASLTCSRMARSGQGS